MTHESRVVDRPEWRCRGGFAGPHSLGSGLRVPLVPGVVPTGTSTLSHLAERQALIARAVADIGVTERGENWGPRIQEYLATIGLSAPQPWCLAAIMTWGREALGERWPCPLTGWTPALGLWASRRQVLRRVPAMGVIVLVWSARKKRFHHAGVGLGPTQGDQLSSVWETIEANSNTDGSANGTMVVRRNRIFGAQDRMVYWWEAIYDGESTTPEGPAV